MQLLCEFTVWGEPLPKERPRLGRGHVFTPTKTVQAERAIRDIFDRHYPLFTPTNNDLRLEVDLYRTTAHRVDTDNLIKLVSDALNKRAYQDDSQISELAGRRYYRAGQKARTEIRIYTLDGAA